MPSPAKRSEQAEGICTHASCGKGLRSRIGRIDKCREKLRVRPIPQALGRVVHTHRADIPLHAAPRTNAADMNEGFPASDDAE